MQITRKTKVFIVLTVLWMGLIFMMSAQNVDKSSDFSDSFTRLILDILEPGQHTDSPPSSDSPAKDAAVTQSEPSVPVLGGNSTDYDPIPNKEWFGVSPGGFKTSVRKAAHFTMFLCLGILVLCTLLSHFKKLRLLLPAVAWLICIVYALLDEFHQLFVEGRGAELADVRLDSTGALVGILLVTACYGIGKGIHVLRTH